MTNDPLLVVRLFGGLGNQLFQLSAARSAERHYGCSARFVIDQGSDPWQIERFLGQSLTRASDSDCFNVGRIAHRWPPWKRRIGARMNMIRRYTGHHATVTQRDEHAFSPVVWPDRGRILLDGYFMERSIIDAGTPLVVPQVVDAAPPSVDSSAGLDRVAVHFRRGDFVRLGWALPMSYYDDALRTMASVGDLTLWVMSDDAILADLLREKYVRHGWTVEDPPVFDTSADLSDFWAITRAQHVIGANSTFSWWASTVGDALWSDHHDRTVISPADWGFGGENRLAAPTWHLM